MIEFDISDGVKPITVVAQLTGAAWKALTEDEKKPFEELAKADKQRYAEEVTFL